MPRVRRRRKRPGDPRLPALYGGLTLSIPTLLVIGSMTYVYVRDVDVTLHKPAWWLVSELDWDPAAEAVAFNELATRMQKGALADHHAAAVAEHFLESQRRIEAPWNAAWSSFIETAHATGKLSKEQCWATTTRSRSAFGVIKRRFASRPTAYPKIGAGLVQHGGGDHR